MNNTKETEGIVWVEIVDPKCKSKMYINLTSGECKRSIPPDVPVKKMDSEQWWELLDPQTNRFYYYNTQTQTTVWEKPERANIIPLAKVQIMRQNMEVENGGMSRAHSASRSSVLSGMYSLPRRRESSRPRLQSEKQSTRSATPVSDTSSMFQSMLGGRTRRSSMTNGSTSRIDRIGSSTSRVSGASATGARGLGGSSSAFQRCGSQPCVPGGAWVTLGGTLPHRSRRSPRPTQQDPYLTQAFEERCTISEASADSGVAPDTASWDENLDADYLSLYYSQQPSFKQQQNAYYQQQQMMAMGYPPGYAYGAVPMGYPVAGGGRLMMGGRPMTSACASLQGTPQIRHRPFPRTNPTLRRANTEAVSPELSVYGTHKRSSSRTRCRSSDARSLASSNPPISGGPTLIGTNGDKHQPDTETTLNGTSKPQPMGDRSRSTASLSSSGTESTVSSSIPPHSSNPHADGLLNAMPALQMPLYDNPPVYAPLYPYQQEALAWGTVDPNPGYYTLRRPNSMMVIQDMAGNPELVPQYPSVGWGMTPMHYPQRSVNNSTSAYTGPLPGWNLSLFRRDQAPTKLLSWTKESIRKPLLLATEKPLKKEACETFKLLQMYMGDRKSKLPAGELLQTLINRGWGQPGLRDEVYVQLCKQTTNNPDELSTCRGWELLCTCLAFFPPSSRFQPYLEGYVLRQLAPTQPGEPPSPALVVRYAEVAAQRVRRATQAGARRGCRPPSPRAVEQAKSSQFDLHPQYWTVGKNIMMTGMFGSSLEDVMVMQVEFFPERRLPWIQVTLSEEVLRLGGAQTEGIFRLPGDSQAVHGLQSALEQWEDISEPDCPGATLDPHVAATLLKQWYRELAEPLVPPEMAHMCRSAVDRPQEARRVVTALPPLNRLCLTYLIRFLQVFAAEENVSATKMDAGNLAMVMAPNLFHWPTTDPQGLLESTRPQSAFLRTLIQHLDTTDMEEVR